MRNVIYNSTDLELLDSFLKTDDPIYVFNLLIRYFYYNISIETKKYSNFAVFNEQKLNNVLKYYIDNFEILKEKVHFDHTIYYSLDIISNIELFRHFLKYPWEEWNDKIIIEAGAGFGIYTYLFNLIKEYYNLNYLIYSLDFSEYKIKKIEKIAAILRWENNVILCADATKASTFKKYSKNVALIYSETFSMYNMNRENYFNIIKNIEKCINLEESIFFPRDFVIKDDSIKEILINGRFQKLEKFEVDQKSEQIMTDLLEEYPNKFGFRWGWW